MALQNRLWLKQFLQASAMIFIYNDFALFLAFLLVVPTMEIQDGHQLAFPFDHCPRKAHSCVHSPTIAPGEQKNSKPTMEHLLCATSDHNDATSTCPRALSTTCLEALWSVPDMFPNICTRMCHNMCPTNVPEAAVKHFKGFGCGKNTLKEKNSRICKKLAATFTEHFRRHF